MSIRRTAARLCAVPVGRRDPRSRHGVAGRAPMCRGTPSDAAAGAFTILTMSVPHGCDGSPTTKVEIQIPESVLSVTPTRNPFYDVEVHDRAARRAGHRRPRQRDHRAHGERRLHREHPAARRPAGHLRAVVPGPGRRGRDARVPDDPDLRAGGDRLGRGARPRARTPRSSSTRRRRSRSCRPPPRTAHDAGRTARPPRRPRTTTRAAARPASPARPRRSRRLRRARLGRPRRRACSGWWRAASPSSDSGTGATPRDPDPATGAVAPACPAVRHRAGRRALRRLAVLVTAAPAAAHAELIASPTRRRRVLPRRRPT